MREAFHGAQLIGSHYDSIVVIYYYVDRKKEGNKSSSLISTPPKSLSLTRRDSSSRFASHRCSNCTQSLI